MQAQLTIPELLKFSIINLDKPSGPTSFGADSIVMAMLRLNKVSHFGTLDPKVTGVLPIALGRACKLTGFFIGHNKTYAGVMHFHEPIEQKVVEQAIKEHFIGIIKQTPPKKSSVKREEREREITSFDIIEQSEDKKDFVFITEVQGGTYIRKLVHDLGLKLNITAHMAELRRTKAGIFSERDKEFCTLYDLEQAIKEYQQGNEEKLRKILIPAEQAIKKILPIVISISDPIIEKNLLTGKKILKNWLKTDTIPDLQENDIFTIFTEQGKFIEIARRVTNENDIFARPLFVYN